MTPSFAVGLEALKALPEMLRERLRVAGSLADQLGMPLFLVGGAARDALLGTPTTDADLVVEGDGPGYAGRLAGAFNGTIRRHSRFGTATVTPGDGAGIDVAMARSEWYPAPGALPVVRPGTITEDLGRRDFTINAIAIRLNEIQAGEIVDPYDGVGDLRRGLIRILHAKSFVDDPTRLFRAVRFEQRLAFQLEERTERLYRNAVTMGWIDRLSGYRLGEQLRLLFEEANPWQGLRRLSELGALRAVHTAAITDDDVQLAFRMLDRNRFSVTPVYTPIWPLYLLALCRNMPDASLAALTTRLRPGCELERALLDLPAMRHLAQQIVEGQADTPSAFYKKAKGVSHETVALFALADPRPTVRQRCEGYLVRDRHIHLAIDGHTLADLGIPPGPVYSRLLEQVLMDKLDERIKSADEERAWALKLSMRLREAEDQTEGR